MESKIKALKLNESMFEQIVEQVLTELEVYSEIMSKQVRLKAGQKYIIEEGLIRSESFEKQSV